MKIRIKMIADEDGYPTNLFIYDTDDGKIGDAKRPIHLGMPDIIELFNKIEPIVKAYEKYLPLQEAYAYGETKVKPKMHVVLEDD